VEEGERLERVRHGAGPGLLLRGQPLNRIDGGVFGVAQRREVDVDATDVLVAIEPQGTAEATAGCDRAEVRLHEVRLVVPRKVDALPARGPEAPDERLDAPAGAGDHPGGGGGELRSRGVAQQDRKSTRLNSSHQIISYAVF